MPALGSCAPWRCLASDLRGKLEQAIYVLHAFQKKKQRIAKRDIELTQRRYELIYH